MEGEIGTKMKW